MIQNKRIIIVAHYLLYGAAHALRDYLKTKNIDKLLCIFLPLISQRNTHIYEYKATKQGRIKKIRQQTVTRDINLGTIDYLIDILQTVLIILFKGKYDVYFGFDPLNCLSGIFLKKIGRVKKVVFYSIDFVPIRFKNNLLNNFYHKIEIFCIKHADETWNVSPRIAEGRKRFLNISQRKYPQSVVPIGVWNDEVKKYPFSKIKKHQILFLGHLLEKQGVQVVIDALQMTIKKISDVHFVIVGGGEYLVELQKKVKNLSLDKYITFTGWIKDRKKIDEMMNESAIAVATYKPEKQKMYNFTYYADPTKIKDYLSAGLPVIITDVSYNAYEIVEKKCGVLVQYDKKDIAKAIISLLSDKKKLILYRRNALLYSKQFDWSNIFKRVVI